MLALPAFSVLGLGALVWLVLVALVLLALVFFWCLWVALVLPQCL